MSNLKIYIGSAWVDIIDRSGKVFNGSAWVPVKPGDHVRGSTSWVPITSGISLPQRFFGTGGPNDNMYDVASGQRQYTLLPGGDDGTELLPLWIFLHGVDQGGTDINKVLEDGLPLVISSTGQLMKCRGAAPQLPSGSWSERLDLIDSCISYMVANYNVDQNRIYLCGLSDGAAGVIAKIIQQPTRFAAYAISSPPANGMAANASLIKDIPGIIIQGLQDQRVGVGNVAAAVDALAAANGRIAPLTQFHYDGDHSYLEWNQHLFNFTTAANFLGLNVEDWMLLHSLGRVQEAGNYVTHAENTQDYLHYLAADRLTGMLAASSDKTALEARLATLKSAQQYGNQRIILAFGTSANPATGNYTRISATDTGTTFTNLVDSDGNATAISFVCQYTQWAADLPGAGPGSYHGLPGGVFLQSRRVYASNTWNFTGLPAGATCRVDIFPYYKTESGTAHYGVTGTIGGVTKNSVDDVYNVLNYLTWDGVAADGSGVLSMALNAQYPASSNDGGLCAIMLTINS
ncbi:carboxylesterase family protein [Chitinophaga parva]|nr:hypothetical protein [Chitinophaga parva]